MNGGEDVNGTNPGKDSEARNPKPECIKGEKITPIPKPEGRHPGRTFIMGSEGEKFSCYQISTTSTVLCEEGYGTYNSRLMCMPPKL